MNVVEHSAAKNPRLLSVKTSVNADLHKFTIGAIVLEQKHLFSAWIEAEYADVLTQNSDTQRLPS